MRAFVYGLFAAFLPFAAWAQDVTGQWQGAFQLPAMQQRFVLQVEKGADGTLNGTAYLLEPLPRRFPVTGLALQGSKLHFAFGPGGGATFEGTLSPDGQTAAGTLTQGPQPRPLTLTHASGAAAWVIDPSPHSVRRIAVDKDVSLEVLDWGGSGPPLVFLAGLGGTAHVFDKLALRFTATRHVYAITRRGFGESSAPAPDARNYTAARLGEDVAAVIDALKLERPVLAGHSVAGEELSAIANRHPEKVAGLVYLDAAYAYGFYVPGVGVPNGVGFQLQSRAMLAQFSAFQQRPTPEALQSLVTGLSDLQKDTVALQDTLKSLPPPPADLPDPPATKESRIADAIINGLEKNVSITPPVLAIFAGVPNPPPTAPAQAAANRAVQVKLKSQQMEAFRAAMPLTVRVVWLPEAAHAVWTTNEEDVVREMNAFMAALK